MPTELFLVGDSNTVPIGFAARERGISILGGPLGAGVDLEQPFFVIHEGRFVLQRAGTGNLQDSYDKLLSFDGPVLSTLGFNTHRLAAALNTYCAARGAAEDWRAVLSEQGFRLTVLDARATALAFYRAMAAYGRQVFFLHSPQIAPLADLPVLRDIEEVLIEAVCATGARLIDVRAEVCDAQGLLRAEFQDRANYPHANQQFGALVLDRLAALVAP